ncbi:TonB-dependent receptor [Novosphingobium sp. KN65.2]|uniref:TonB-dependent receptor n=1 Tax=Novosphingobium sp. KN65.2 TaxID=1478134 RepID=UPI0005E97C39|nr:TonB-dependent receptor [Novosphingobium sp. KN65.2]CDO35349.1 TonB-dependent receptor [Novosphingobium sp. KN65.2]
MSDNHANRIARRMKAVLTSGTVLPLILFAGHAHAQDAQAADGNDAAMPGEIVVTATRKSESLSKVPLSVVAKSQIELDKQGVRSVKDIAQITPGITFGQSAILYGTGQSSIAIRGISSTSGIPTTGVYIDDTPVQTRVGVSPSLSNPYPQVFDLQRVEVLRGPQGTLFGSGSVGGAIRFIMPEPNYSDVGVYARSEIATTEHGSESYEAGIAGGAPIVQDKVGFRASVWYRHDGGYVDRLDRATKQLSKKDTNSENNFTARLAVGAKLSDSFTITPSIYYQDQDIKDSSRFEVATSKLSSGNLKNSLNAISEPHKEWFTLPALKMQLDLGSMTLISGTSYFYRKTRTGSDDTTLTYAFDAGIVDGPFPLPGFEDYVPTTQSRTKQRAFTQELRLQNNNSNDRFNWIAGFFYQRSYVQDQYVGVDPRILDLINYAQDQAGEEPFGSLTDVFGVELYEGKYSLLQRNRHWDRQAAFFGQADYEILPRLKLTAGLRYTIANYKFEGLTAGPVYSTDGNLVSEKNTGRTLTPKFGISFQADRNNLFYVNAAKGVRGAGVSPPVGANCVADAQAIGFDPYATLTVNPDSIWSYEAGSKNKFFGGMLSVDASAYHVDWKNVQTQFALPQCTLYTALNLGSAKIDGFDLSVGVQPAEGLTLGASVSYIHARYTTPVTGLVPDGTGDTVPGIIRPAGEPFPGVAPWTVQLNGEYNRPIGNAELYTRADFSYASHNKKPVFESPLYDPAYPRSPATSQLNLRFGARLDALGEKDLDISLFVNNVTNEQPLLSLYHDTLNAPRFRSGTFRPRTIGLTVSVRK